jgi:Fe-Mn family superoxide dismutase
MLAKAWAGRAQIQEQKIGDLRMAYTLSELPYSLSALEPYINTRTMAVHYNYHHRAYVNNLNNALAGYDDLQQKDVAELLVNLDAVPEKIRAAVRNNGGGHVNHSLFWPCLSPKGGGAPSGTLADAINESFGSVDDFKSQFSQAAATRFGSGWAWLCLNRDNKAVVTSTPNQDNPISEGLIPILGLDVWEHAYYLTYENRRPDYIAAFWNIVKDQVGRNYRAIQVAADVGQLADSVKSFWTKLTGSDEEADA